MIYRSNQSETMSFARKSSSSSSSPRVLRRNLQSKSSVVPSKRNPLGNERCRGRCRVQWSEKHVKEGLVLVQEAQLARVVKTGPITEHYEIDPKPFASGQWARVYKCRSRSSGTIYAAKFSSRNRFNTDCSAELRHEIALLSLCSQSVRVVKLHDVYETPKEIILVMEYAPGGDLQTLIDGDLVPLEGDVVHFVRQLVEGLAYLHERNIAHLDIKPQNLVMMGTFPECNVKLCDFEISRVVLEGTEVREILGTPDYVAPEILHYEPITLAADMWSLGVTTYVLLTGFSPFGGETDQETFQNISQGDVDFPEELFEDVSAQAKDFVAKLLVLEPSARMTAKQCLRHDWLRGAPTQASPHLRKYLSKSREILLERVVSRENLRRATLLNQSTMSQANLTEEDVQSEDGLKKNILSQSEICLNYNNGSQMSLSETENFLSPTNSQTSLNSSRASLSCFLNKEQTQGLLSRAQSRSQANLLNHGKGLLSRMRSFNRIQSQACLNSTSSKDIKTILSKSREKLYGLRSLSKSQGVLDIYQSLESLKNRRRQSYQRARTEDLLPVLQKLDGEVEKVTLVPALVGDEAEPETPKIEAHLEEENLDSLRSVESDTLTEDSDETSLHKRTCERQNSDISSHNSDEKDDHLTESETEEPKYTVAQLISAFNTHQEVASRTSVKAIISEKQNNEIPHFPTGPKALRLFIPDISIKESSVVRRKTSYKPRKNWEELRKLNEKNEGILIKDFDNDSGNEDDEDEEDNNNNNNNNNNDDNNNNDNNNKPSEDDSVDTKIDEKYKQCVDGINKHLEKERMPNYICSEKVVNLKDILDKDDCVEMTPKENLENLRKRTSITKIILSDNLLQEDHRGTAPEGPTCTSVPRNSENGVKLEVPPSFFRSSSISSESSCPTPSSIQSEIGMNWEHVSEEQDSPSPLEKDAIVEKKVGKERKISDGGQRRIHEEKGSSPKPEEKRIWGKICTGSYTRAMEKFNGKGGNNRSSLLNSSQNERNRKKSNCVIPQFTES